MRLNMEDPKWDKYKLHPVRIKLWNNSVTFHNSAHCYEMLLLPAFFSQYSLFQVILIFVCVKSLFISRLSLPVTILCHGTTKSLPVKQDKQGRTSKVNDRPLIQAGVTAKWHYEILYICH